MIREGESSLKESCLALVYFSMKGNSPVLKLLYVRAQIIEAAIPLLTDTSRMVRILAAGTCARLYRNYLKGQHRFLRNKGEI